jgi:aspartyl-tRNA(Asn)/glutamyl-tRNA(Gln) amidotransferase subunit A
MFFGFASLQDLVRAVQRRRVSPSELVRASLDAIAREQPRLNAFITVIEEPALAAAARLEKKGATPGRLAGVPVAVKDLLFTKDAPTTAGSRIYDGGLITGGDADVVARLRRAGAVIIGKTNLHEVALGVTSVNEHFGPARNPWNPEHVSGGSSGGSAVAVAADLCPAAIGTDTRGSIRIPAACCGITGFKPTYGLVSVVGVLPLAFSLDHVGPMARSVDDVRLLLGAMLGGRPVVQRLDKVMKASTRRLVVGISEYHMRDLDSRVARRIEAALRDLRPLVRDLREVRIPELEGVQEASSVIAGSEAVTFHDANIKARPDAYGPLVLGRMKKGYDWTAVDYVNARQKPALVRAAFDQVFREVDVLAGASLPALSPRIDASQQVTIDGREVNTVEAFTRCNSPQNVAGLPALSVPCGLADGFPVGLQLFGAEGGDGAVLAVGAAYQRNTDWHMRTPPTGARRKQQPR